MADISNLAGLGSMAALGAMTATFAIIFLLAIVAVYIYSALALMAIAKKTNAKNAWLAWIPIANVYLMIMIAGFPWWAIFALLLPFIPVIGNLALMAGAAWCWWKISEKRSRPGWFGILMIIPFVNFIILGILAWKD